MIEDNARRDAQRWIKRIFREGATRDDLHCLVDGVLDGMLRDALGEAASERQRADIAEGQADRVTDELTRLRAGLAALGEEDRRG